jgi:two-component sensor histidine kinase
LPKGYNPAATTGFGMRVISALVGQLHARLISGEDGDGWGAKITVLVPVVEETR